MKMKRFLTVLLVLIGHLVAPSARADEALDALVEVLLSNTDAQLDLDLLRGMRDGYAGSSRMVMPKGWQKVELRLLKSPSAEVRELTKSLAVKFGSQSAMAGLRAVLSDANSPINERRKALNSLTAGKDAELVNLALPLLQVAALRNDSLRALAGYADERIAPELIKFYPTLKTAQEKRAVLNVLVSRPSNARALLTEIAKGRIQSRDLTADVVRQLRGFNQPDITAAVVKLWGVIRESPEEKKREIALLKVQLLGKPASKPDSVRGREIFNLICGQCHTLFGVGGKVGPDITGANRGDLDYLLHNILDPNAEIPNEYRTTNIDTKDERSITGIVTREDPHSVTVVTATETLTIGRKDIEYMKQGQLSMMPEGLLQPLKLAEVRALLAYLQSTRQVPLKK